MASEWCITVCIEDGNDVEEYQIPVDEHANDFFTINRLLDEICDIKKIHKARIELKSCGAILRTDADYANAIESTIYATISPDEMKPTDSVYDNMNNSIQLLQSLLYHDEGANDIGGMGKSHRTGRWREPASVDNAKDKSDEKNQQGTESNLKENISVQITPEDDLSAREIPEEADVDNTRFSSGSPSGSNILEMDEKSTGTEPLNSSLGDAADIGASPAVNTGGEEDLQNQVANNPAKKEAKIFELNPVQATRKLANFDIKFDTALSDHQGSREETGDRRKNSSAHAISIMDRCLFRIIASSAFNASPKISNGLVEKNKFGEIILEDSELMQYFPENLHKSKVHDMVTGSIKEEEKLLDFESIISILRREERDIMIDAPDRDIRKPSSTEVELEYKDDCEFVKVTSTDDAVQVARRFVFQNSLDVTQVEQYSDQVKESQLPICQADLKAGKVEARRLLKQVELTENLILENEAALEKAQEVANQHKLSLRDICKKVAVGKKNSAKTSSPGRKKYKSSTLVRNFAKKIIEAKRELEFNQRELERIKRASLALTQQHVRVVKSEKADKLWAKARRNFIKDRKDPKKIGTYDNVVHDALHHRSFGTIVNQLMDQRSILNKGQQGEIQNVDVDVEFATIAGNDMEFASVDKDNDNQLNRSEFDSWLLEKQAIMQKIQEDKRKLITEGMRLRKMVDENAESHAYELRLRARLIEHEGIEKQIKMEEMVVFERRI